MNNELINKLENENRVLKRKLALLIDENHTKDEIVIQQSKMASMGEMIGNIAHQWRQPLMEISSLIINTEAKIKIVGNISNDELLDTIDKSNHIIKFMSETIDDFRNFFATNKNEENFMIIEQVNIALNMLKSSFDRYNIKINIIIKSKIEVYGIKNEYLQVLLNILSNAKDAIVSNKISNGCITIKIYEKTNSIILEIENNGGIIDIEPINKVFEPFFTYKKNNGTGVGLFMSKLIIENNMNGLLKVHNIKNGVCFSIALSI